jgi:hypothetical protein
MCLWLIGVTDALAEEPPWKPSDVTLAWGSTDLAITSTVGDVEVVVRLKYEFGDEDVFVTEKPVVVLGDETVLFTPTWPDFTAKGAKTAIPGVVSGFADVTVVATAEQVGSRRVARRLVTHTANPETYPTSELETLLSDVALDVESDEGEVATGVDPEGVDQ